MHFFTNYHMLLVWNASEPVFSTVDAFVDWFCIKFSWIVVIASFPLFDIIGGNYVSLFLFLWSPFLFLIFFMCISLAFLFTVVILNIRVLMVVLVWLLMLWKCKKSEICLSALEGNMHEVIVTSVIERLKVWYWLYIFTYVCMYTVL